MMASSRLSPLVSLPMSLCWPFVVVLMLAGPVIASAAEPPIDFNRDIRSILSNNCFQCHGPDPAERQADLRLDTAEGIVAEHDGHAAVVPGDPAKSVLLERVTTTDPDLVMPPP